MNRTKFERQCVSHTDRSSPIQFFYRFRYSDQDIAAFEGLPAPDRQWLGSLWTPGHPQDLDAGAFAELRRAAAVALDPGTAIDSSRTRVINRCTVPLAFAAGLPPALVSGGAGDRGPKTLPTLPEGNWFPSTACTA